jgi:hypothetical protein
MEFDLNQSIVDDRWQFSSMGIGNYQRRIPIIYTMPAPEPVPTLAAALGSVFQQVAQFASSYPAIMTLDNNQPENTFFTTPPGYHPVGWFCESNRNTVQQRYVDPLIDRIQGKVKPHVAGVPETLANKFIAYYNSLVAADQSLKAQYDPIIKQLQQFAQQAASGS